MVRGQRLSRQSLFLGWLARTGCGGAKDIWPPLLSSIIRQKVPNGYLPSIRPAEVFGGPGAGGQCVACNRELRVTFRDGLPTLDRHVLFVHGDCFIVWDSERAAMWPTVLGLS